MIKKKKMGTIVSLQISIFCHEKKKKKCEGYKKILYWSLSDWTHVLLGVKSRLIQAPLHAGECNLSQLELQQHTGGRAQIPCASCMCSTWNAQHEALLPLQCWHSGLSGTATLSSVGTCDSACLGRVNGFAIWPPNLLLCRFVQLG